MKVLQKIANCKGFSLLESMAALLIISILTVGITTGVNAASKIYQQSLFVSEGDILAATVDTALSDVLRFSSEISEEDGVVSFTNANYSVKKGHLLSESGWLYLNLRGEEDAPLVLLLNNGVYSSMEINSFQLSYAEGVFSGSYEIKSKKDDTLVKKYAFHFRTLS